MPAAPVAAAVKVVISSSSKDAKFAQALQKHLSNLERQGEIQVWTHHALLPGSRWEPTLLAQLQSAELVILLVSADFNTSGYIQEKELAVTLERHRRGEVDVLPVFVRAVDLGGQWLDELVGLPSNRKPVANWSQADDAWMDVVAGIRKMLPELRERRRKSGEEAALVVTHEISASTRQWRTRHPYLLLIVACLVLVSSGMVIIAKNRSGLSRAWGAKPAGITSLAGSAEPEAAEMATRAKKSGLFHTERTSFEVSSSPDQGLPPLPAAVPLWIIWLEDARDPALSARLENPANLRQFLATQLLPMLLSANVAAIALDIGFDGTVNVVGRDALRKTLQRARQLRIPVVALRPYPGQLPLIDSCREGQLTPPGCFHMLVPGAPPPGIPRTLADQPETVAACHGGHPSLALVVARWLRELQTSLEGKLEPGPALGDCPDPSPALRLYAADARAYREMSAGQLLAKGAEAQQLDFEGQVVLVADRNPSGQDRHDVRDAGLLMHLGVDGGRLLAEEACNLVSILNCDGAQFFGRLRE